MNSKTLNQASTKYLGKEADILDYISIMKPRVMSLVVFTAFTGMVLAPNTVSPFISLIAILCISIAAGACGAINMWYDADIDLLMKRTQKRPTVTGIIHPNDARDFGVVLGFFSIMIMAVFVNLTSAFLLSFIIFHYIIIYTIWLKRSSIHNIFIGGVSGALPPVIGWTSVGSKFSIEPIVLFLIIFLWTLPHSWALALYRFEEYKNCQVPMLPIVKGVKYTKYLILFYSLLLFAVSLLPFYIGMSGWVYLSVAFIMGLNFIYLSYQIYKYTDKLYTFKLFKYSIIYLFMIFSILIVDKVL